MGPITYALCKKPVIGIAMFIASLCAFPPLVHHVPVYLEAQGDAVSGTFTVPVEKSYELDLVFEFPSREAMTEDQVAGKNYDEYCEHVPLNETEWIPGNVRGRPIPLQVLVRDEADGRIVVDRIFNTLCIYSHGATTFDKWRKIGRVTLPIGEYSFELKNLKAQAGLIGVHTYVSLIAGHGK
jgi:hypothetical protein